MSGALQPSRARMIDLDRERRLRDAFARAAGMMVAGDSPRDALATAAFELAELELVGSFADGSDS